MQTREIYLALYLRYGREVEHLKALDFSWN